MSSVPCMLNHSKTIVQIDAAVERAAERSEAALSTAAGDRSDVPRSSKTVTEHDRRRLRGSSPNSRRNRRRSTPQTSSHLQDRDYAMDGSITSFVGIDVAKNSLEACVLPDQKPFSIGYDRAGLMQLLGRLPQSGTCLIVVESTGGYHRRLVAELLDAGHLVAVVNPRQVRDFAKAFGILDDVYSRRPGADGPEKR